MAISRDQPMRPALGDVLGVVDRQDADITGLAALLPSASFTDESTVADAIGAEATAREGLAALLPSASFTDESTVADAIGAEAKARAEADAALASWYRKGQRWVTVAASSSETVTIDYDEPFDADTICMTTYALDATAAADADVTVTLDASGESGITFTVANASADGPKSVVIAYFTVGV